MNKKILTAIGITLLFLGTCITPSIAIDTSKIPISLSNTLYVGGTGEGNYSNIRDAIDDATDGDTVFVFDDSSPYYENIIVDKSINLIGENKETTVIEGREKKNGVLLFADGILLSGFSIVDCKGGLLLHFAGVRGYTNNSTIINNNIQNCDYGIYFEYLSNNNVISENYIAYNDIAGITIDNNSNSNFVFNNIIEYNDLDDSYGGGIFIFSSFDNLIDNNSLIDNSNGIKLSNSSSNKISNNSFINNSCVLVRGRENTVFRNNFTGGTGIVLEKTVDNLVINNTISRPSWYGKSGVVLTDADYNRIIGNKITEKFNGITCQIGCNGNIIEDNIIDSNYRNGITLLDAGDCNVIVGNSICNNNIHGIYINESSKSIFCYNNINFNNGIGIYLVSNSNNNIINGNKISNNLQGINISEYSGFNNNIFHNNFFDNENKNYDEFDNYWDDGYPSGGNFWDDYNGEDADGDGIGDTPYPISGGDNQDRYPLMLSYVNQGAPERPLIGGEIKVKKGKEYNYTFVTIDPDNDKVFYYLDWGDNTSSGWIGPYSSGVPVIQPHKWSKKGAYIIKAKAKDINGEESDWGTLQVTIPRTRISSYHWLFERFPLLERLLFLLL